MEPRMNADERGWEELTERIIACADRVSNELGCGFLETVYKRAMLVELWHEGLTAEAEKSIQVRYRDEVVGEYFADIVVDGCIILELKAAKELDAVHSVQCINYLKATGFTLCLLMNFGNPKAKAKRIVRNF
jgi:GxxExxY protein